MLFASPLQAEISQTPWSDRALPPDQRARLLLAAMTLDEKLALVHTRFGTPFRGHPKPDGAMNSAGFNPGIPRLAIPPLQETDAGLGVTNPTSAAVNATALPSGLAIGATFDPDLARRGGAMIGSEARAFGFNIMLAGGADLTRDPRNGRNFEYIGEDPLLTGVMAGAMIDGIQSQGVMSTLKHFAVNDQETGRVMLDSVIGEQAARESDLLAFEIALEQGKPRAVMTGYNKINGQFASENPFLIKDVLKGDWRYDGWVMSDWGATHSTENAALAGLDQESGEDLDGSIMFDAPLKNAIQAGRVPAARLDDMVFRIARAAFASGSIDHPAHSGGAIDEARNASVSEAVARRGIVLLKNDKGRLPLPRTLRRILVIGEHADFGVLSGGGSSQVVPIGALRLPGDPPGKYYGQPKLYDPSSPLHAILREAPGAKVDFLDGHDSVAAAQAAHDADVVVLFAEQWMNEARDAPSLALPLNQDRLIAAVAAANPNTVVVLQTGGPVTMPWLSNVPAVMEAWYSGARGGDAIAAVLFGAVNPSGRLPITFPQTETELPRPAVRDPESTTANPGEPLKGEMFSVDYNVEGPDVGYKWFFRTGHPALFPFGYGLSYTRFSTGAVTVTSRHGIATATFDVTNTGARDGIDTPQVYIDSPAGLFTRRLAGWQSVALRPGEKKRVSVAVDPRLLARFDVKDHCWHVSKGRYTVSVRPDAVDTGPSTTFQVSERDLRP
ncbi:beta-glucosidase [Beijerinckia sp. L45]|uniref:beta-glucosidase n=1 Tax=Beijerinckia sp. L45 TaxID=1641855 RepID=UPI001AEE6635|nr:beta-glucosidase [Beijerinckia sp. L45]